jgi:hypothetical protein
MNKKDHESKREDLNHDPANAGKVGEEHKQLNEKGEAPRPRAAVEPKKP